MPDPLTYLHDYFAHGGGFRFDMRDVMLGGPVTEWYDRGDKRWYVVQEVGGRRWEGMGESRAAAILDLIAQRMDAFPVHRPRRDDEVAAWLKAKRDEYEGALGPRNAAARDTLDSLLDEYRLRADTGATLSTPLEEIGPHDA